MRRCWVPLSFLIGFTFFAAAAVWAEKPGFKRFGVHDAYWVPAQAGLNSGTSRLGFDYFIPWRELALRASFDHMEGGGHLLVSGQVAPVNRSLTGIDVALIVPHGRDASGSEEPRFYSGVGFGYWRTETHAWDTSGARLSTTDFTGSTRFLAGVSLAERRWWELGWDYSEADGFGGKALTGGLYLAYGYRF